MNLNGVPTNPELAAAQSQIITVVLQVHQTSQNGSHVVVHPDHEIQELPAVLLGVPHAVNARHRSHNNDITPGQQRGRSRMSEAINFIIDRGVLLNEGVT